MEYPLKMKNDEIEIVSKIGGSWKKVKGEVGNDLTSKEEMGRAILLPKGPLMTRNQYGSTQKLSLLECHGAVSADP
jgi:hypothetical protein